MRRNRSVPVRTCVGCRERAAKSDLLRVVGVEIDGVPSVVPDPRGRLPGRGASLHPVLACLDLAERRRAFARALRRPGPLDTSRVRAAIEEQAHRHDQQHQQYIQQPSEAGRDRV